MCRNIQPALATKVTKDVPRTKETTGSQPSGDAKDII